MSFETSPVSQITVEISVVLGKATMPIHQLLRMGRGAVIELDTKADTPCHIYADRQLIACGEILVSGDRLAVSILELTT